jgi:hypothetical protein
MVDVESSTQNQRRGNVTLVLFCGLNAEGVG